MRSECPYCADLDKYNLDPAKPVTLTVHDTGLESRAGIKEVTRMMHKGKNEVSWLIGVECSNPVPVTKTVSAKKKLPKSHEIQTP